jgi:hypothetical protein
MVGVPAPAPIEPVTPMPPWSSSTAQACAETWITKPIEPPTQMPFVFNPLGSIEFSGLPYT